MAVAGLDKNLGSEAWANKIRKHAKELARHLDSGYMELAKTLYEVYSVPEGGDPKKGPVYKTWGFKSFAEYAENELSLHRRKAEMLRAVWYRIGVELDTMPDDLRERLVKLGWTKVRELTRVITLRNAKEWIEKAEDATQPQLVEAIQKHVEAKKKKAAEKAKAKEATASEPATAEEMKEALDAAAVLKEAAEAGGSAKAQGAPGNGAAVEEDDDLPVPPIEDLKGKFFNLYPDQYEVVQAALARAEQLAENKKPSHLLALICTDFIATNDFKLGDLDDKRKFIAKYEQMLGVKLIAVDDGGDVIYGISTLEQLAKEGGEG